MKWLELQDCTRTAPRVYCRHIDHICFDVWTNERAKCKRSLSHTPSLALEVWECHHFSDTIYLERMTKTCPVTQTTWKPHIKPAQCLCQCLWLCFCLSSCIRMHIHVCTSFEKKTTPPKPPLAPHPSWMGYWDGRCQTGPSSLQTLCREAGSFWWMMFIF